MCRCLFTILNEEPFTFSLLRAAKFRREVNRAYHTNKSNDEDGVQLILFVNYAFQTLSSPENLEQYSHWGRVDNVISLARVIMSPCWNIN